MPEWKSPVRFAMRGCLFPERVWCQRPCRFPSRCPPQKRQRRRRRFRVFPFPGRLPRLHRLRQELDFNRVLQQRRALSPRARRKQAWRARFRIRTCISRVLS